MRVTSIGLWVGEEEVANFSYDDPMSLQPYMARAILGLDADELKPGFYGFGAGSGQKFYNVERPKPTVVMRIVLNPSSELRMTFSQLRDNLYRVIAANRSAEVMIKFFAGATQVAEIPAGITKFEVPHNSQTPELQITAECRDTLLRAPNPVDLENNDLSGTNPIAITDGLSTAPHGFEFYASITSPISQFRIHDPDNEWGFEIQYDFLTGDDLFFSSVGTDKEVWVERSGVRTYLADKIEPASLWPVLFHGVNEFVIDELASVNIDLISFKAAYWGV